MIADERSVPERKLLARTAIAAAGMQTLRSSGICKSHRVSEAAAVNHRGATIAVQPKA
jgi:hypothetical protein